MKTTSRVAPRLLLVLAGLISGSLILPGCGNSDSPTPPRSVSGLKSPSDILKEAKAKEPQKEPVKKP
jgi:hypothetical protein